MIMMSNFLYQYISPHIYPLLPSTYGKFQVSYSMHNLAKYRVTPGFTGELTISFRSFMSGKELGIEHIPVPIVDGKVSIQNIVREFIGDDQGDALGYVELVVTANEPAFTKMLLPQSYGLFSCPGVGDLTFGSDLKFAREQIVDQIAAFKQFCMHHSANYVSMAANIGNSFVFVNPYHQTVLAKLATSAGRQERVKVPPCSTVIYPKQQILEDGVWDTIMITGNNRFTIFDLRHAYDTPHRINNIDHIDFMNSMPVFDRIPLKKVAKRAIRKMIRNTRFMLR